MNEEQLMTLIKEKKYEEALKILFENIEQNPEDPVNYINAGTILADSNQINEAERFFQKSIVLDESHGGAYYGLACIYYNQERYEEAVKLFQKAIENELKDADTYYMLGMSFVNLGDFSSAMPYLMRASELNDEDEEILFQYGLILCQLSMYREAVEVLNRVIRKNSQHTDALYNKALAQYMLDEDLDDAINRFKEIIDIQPDHLLAGHAYQSFQLMKEE